MNLRAVFAIVRKDLKVVRQNKGVFMPIMIGSLVVFAILPWGVSLFPLLEGAIGNDIQLLVDLMSTELQQEFAAYGQYQAFFVYILVYMMAPIFLLLPLMLSTVIAADSFAGEKERKTMEALLYTPTTDRELFVAKLLSGWLAAISVAFAGFALYTVSVNAVGWSQMGHLFFPNSMWLVLVFWVVPAMPGLGLGAMVLVSARAQGFQDANQLGMIVILPVMVLGGALLSGAMSFSFVVMFLIGFVVWLLDGLLIWLGSRSFRRGRLLGA